ncbi:arylsulfatase [Pontiella sulfatireligans]|uniref:Arylsulfatase n=1 Tax=Pontiella sulfatireligans TaxID=2750658 RepID=A0A6C2UTS5_9BACT|nr:arylsulfatase [Pontiella sulfatireligans]SPS74529.1 sulfatase S1_17 [Kiritimatiellales bacterium]VGO22691.1 Arylsulfatase [Pontiella sulfatireligans]
MKCNLVGNLVVSLALCVGVHAAQPPNVIVIMTDDQGYGDLSVHGNPVLKTPELDKLHAQSVRFTDFHVAPMCTPTRGQLMSGMDAMRNGATEVNSSRSVLRGDIQIMPQYFKDAGYATGMFGKWHLGDSYPFSPRFRGFDETLRHRHWGITSSADYWGNTYFDPVLEYNGVDKPFKGYCTDIFFKAAMDWMARSQQQGKPFFVYLPTNVPHSPNQSLKKYSDPYKGQYKGKKIPHTYYGMIANLDDNIGRLDTFLKEKGLLENTIIMYLSDNGTQSGEASKIYNAGMRDKKASTYEGGHRAPLFVRWFNGNLAHGKDISELTQVQDILPTLMDLCGLEGDRSAFSGSSLVGLLKGTQSKLDDRMCVIQYQWVRRGSAGGKWESAAVLWNKWRLLRGKKGMELYNITEDPAQKKNVIDAHPEVAESMSAHYDAWYQEVKPNLEHEHHVIVGSDEENPIKIYSNEWVGDYCTNLGALKSGNTKGYWNLDVAQDGEYEIELRRWPEESDKTLIDSMDGKSEKGAVPVAKVRLQVGDFDQTVDVKQEDKLVRFRVNLKRGATQLTGSLLNTQDKVICSTPYVKIVRK